MFLTCTCGPPSSVTAVLTMWTCCIRRSQYNLSSDFLDLSVSGLESTNKQYWALTQVQWWCAWNRKIGISEGKCKGQYERLRWSRGSVLAFGTQVRGFKPGRSRWLFQGKEIFSTPSFGGEVKPSVPCRRFTACKRSLNVMWKSSIFRQNSSAISQPCSSTFGC